MDKFQTGAVLVEVIQDVPYFDSLEVDEEVKLIGKPIEKQKATPQFKKGERVKLQYRIAGIFAANRYCNILDEKYQAVDVKTVAKKAK